MNKYGFFRVAACVPSVSVADCNANTRSICELAAKAYANGCDLAVFPEMCVSGYTCADLFLSSRLVEASKEALIEIAAYSAETENFTIVVGAPVLIGASLYNCAVVIEAGFVKAIVPKTYLPNYNEFYEKRWWQPAPKETFVIDYINGDVTFGTDQLITMHGVNVGIEICEDLWTPVPPSCHAAMSGAHLILNLSASDDLIGKYAYIKQLVAQQSARCLCAYAYVSAGYGESSTDLVFDGKAFIAENGKMLAERERWLNEPGIVMADLDMEAIEHDRMRNGSFHDCAVRNGAIAKSEGIALGDYMWPAGEPDLLREVDPRPFVPPTDEAMAMRCDEIVNIQAAGLAKRLDFIHAKKLVVGISGGLDSTLALLVAVKAFDRLGFDRKGIIGITMPGFGTSDRTHDNAVMLMEQLGITAREISIAPAVRQHFADIGHDMNVHDVTYENSQARERTQILMDVANKENAIVLGTGDLSELALGWATYNGDHMSMYAVNAGVPKTLVRYLVKYFAMEPAYAACRDTLLDIVDTPISPELIPTDSQGNIAQKTEDLVGPYELHDFFLYYTLRYGFAPAKIYFLAKKAFAGAYDDATIEKWLRTFIKRFFQQQFKRSCMPDGPKVGSVCLSPRGDWRMPSDASSAQWLDFDVN